MDDLLPGLRAVLATTPARWVALTAAVPDNLLRRVPAPGEWAVIDCLRHLRDAERDVFQVRLEAFRAGQDLVPYDPERDGRASHGESVQALAEDFARLRAVSLEDARGRTARGPGDHRHPRRVRAGAAGGDAALLGGPRPDAHRPGRARPDAAVHRPERRLEGHVRRLRRRR